MKTKDELDICRSYDAGAEAYARDWGVPHAFTEEDRRAFCELLPEEVAEAVVGGLGDDLVEGFVSLGFPDLFELAARVVVVGEGDLKNPLER